MQAFEFHGRTAEIERDGFRYVARIEDDDTATTPWENEDGHGPVREVRPSHYGPHPLVKNPGERVLHGDSRNGWLLYDYAEAVKIAKRDGWGTHDGRREGESAGAYAARAAQEDYEALRGFCRQDWGYVGVVVTVYADGVELASDSLWGVDYGHPFGNDAYLSEVANDCATEAIAEARKTLAALAKRA